MHGDHLQRQHTYDIVHNLWRYVWHYHQTGILGMCLVYKPVKQHRDHKMHLCQSVGTIQKMEHDYRDEFNVYSRTAVFTESADGTDQSVAHMAAFHAAFDEVLLALPDPSLLTKNEVIRAMDGVFTHIRSKNMLCAIWAYYISRSGAVDKRLLDEIVLPPRYTQMDILRYARAFIFNSG
ncbi:hypothetical protein [Three spot gourami iridovirus]|nr:hypothetical protein [South American cichlid iridovirus]AVR29846.1 hypothetical protein [Three spot gourami iridovirus]